MVSKQRQISYFPVNWNSLQLSIWFLSLICLWVSSVLLYALVVFTPRALRHISCSPQSSLESTHGKSPGVRMLKRVCECTLSSLGFSPEFSFRVDSCAVKLTRLAGFAKAVSFSPITHVQPLQADVHWCSLCFSSVLCLCWQTL